MHPPFIVKRSLILAIAALLGGTVVACGGSSNGATSSKTCSLTPSQTEGPYFRSGTPLRTKINLPRSSGRRLIIAGLVRTRSCRILRHARLEFWQADASGDYDNSGYHLRGHLFTDATGHYRVETIVPGLYPGRTRHIHVKVRPSGGPTLTTQLYFPGEPRNATDSIYDRRTQLTIDKRSSTWRARFNFAVRT